LRNGVWEKFEADKTVEASVLGFIHYAHAAAEALKDSIMRNRFARGRLRAQEDWLAAQVKR
jgi:hypothetical protein